MSQEPLEGTNDLIHMKSSGFPGDSDSKESACNTGDWGSTPGLGRYPGEENGNPLQYSFFFFFLPSKNILSHITIPSYHQKLKMKLLSHVQLFATPWTVPYQAPPSMGFSRQEFWSGLPFLSPSPVFLLGESHGQSYSSEGHKELDTTE